MDEAIFLVALHGVPGIGNATIKQLIHHCGSAEQVFSSSTQQLLAIPGIGPQIAHLHSTMKAGLPVAEKKVSKTVAFGGRVIPFTSEKYPSKLREINDCPPVLFMKGEWDVQNTRAVGIVGTRNATDYGKMVVEELIDGLAGYNPLIISGLAYGIDLQAHKVALKKGLQTVGVMGSGLDIIYPKIHTKVADQMLDAGGLATEHPLGTKPDAPHFPMRNRIIAGMSDAVIVVEAGVKGGALITAELANGYGRDVLAVPGNLHSSYSEGCNALIRNHKANILTNPDDVAYLLNWPETNTPLPKADVSALTKDEQNVILSLQSRPKGMHIDELSIETAIPIPLLAGLLLQLEFSDWILSLPGKMYKTK